MLTRMITAAALIVVTAGLVLSAGQPAARASGAGGGNGFGSVTCGQSYSPSCAVSAGSPGSTSTGTGSSARPGDDGTTLDSGSGGSSGCDGTENKEFGCVPAGCTITVQTLACPLGNPATGGGGARAKPPAPVVLAELAVRYLKLPSPVIRSSPSPADLQLTRLPVWLWISSTAWASRSKTASVPGESATATATPVVATWQTGDGTAVTCRGPGIPYTSSYAPSSASPDCGHSYTRSSAGQPGSAYHVTVTITWRVTWTATGGAGGTLAALYTTAGAEFRVAESQALNGGQ